MNYANWIIPIVLVLILGGFYFGKKISVFFKFSEKWHFIVYWCFIYIFVSISFLGRTLITGFLLYFLVFSLIYDFLHWSLSHFERIKTVLEKIYWKGVPFIIISILITIYGAYNLHHPIITEYNVPIDNLKEEMTIGMISDLHLGVLYDEDIFTSLLNKANEMNADIFILNGDIFDEYTTDKLKDLAYEKFFQIKTKYGTYFVEGNHDLLTEETRDKYESHGIKILDDKVIQINNNINLIGRKDYRNNKLGNPRATLNSLIDLTDKSLPIITLDHQPSEQELSRNLGIALQISGHTHAGQIFPGNFILQYGHKKKDNYQIIVSSGYGAWAFPIRTAGSCEMVKINLLPN